MFSLPGFIIFSICVCPLYQIRGEKYYCHLYLPIQFITCTGILFLYMDSLYYPVSFHFWRRQWQPTPVLLPGKSHGWRGLVGCSPWGRQESDTTERLHFHFSLSRIGEGNGNPLQCSCLENPRDGGAQWAAVYGVAQSRTRLKQLSRSSSSSSPFISAQYMMYRVHLLTTNFLSFHLSVDVLNFPSFFKGNFFRCRNLYYVIFPNISSMLLYFSNSKFLCGFLFYNAYFLFCCRRHVFDPWVGKISWRRKWQPTRYSCIGSPMDRGALQATVHGVSKEVYMTERLNNKKIPLFIFSISSQHRDGTQVSRIAGRFFTI